MYVIFKELEHIVMTLQTRQFQSDKDVEALHQIIAAYWQAYGPKATFHVGDLHWRLRPQPERSPRQDIFLLHEDGELLGFAWFDLPDSGDLLCHPEADRTVVEPILLEWLENKARSQNMTDFGLRGEISSPLKPD